MITTPETREWEGICDGCAQLTSECLCDIDLADVLDCNSPHHPGCRLCEAAPAPRTMKQEVRTLRKYLREMIAMDRGVIAAMDAEMQKPSDHERGKRIARIINALAFSADLAERYGLHIQVERTPKKRIGPAVNRRPAHAD